MSPTQETFASLFRAYEADSGKYEALAEFIRSQPRDALRACLNETVRIQDLGKMAVAGSVF